jgi:hypothetical protein
LKKYACLAVAAAFGIAFMLIGAGSASALPNTCSTRSEANYGYADCYSGYGQFRAVTKCDEKWWPDPTVYGPWVQVGGPYTGSGAQCGIGERAYDTTYQLRD